MPPCSRAVVASATISSVGVVGARHVGQAGGEPERAVRIARATSACIFSISAGVALRLAVPITCLADACPGRRTSPGSARTGRGGGLREERLQRQRRAAVVAVDHRRHALEQIALGGGQLEQAARGRGRADRRSRARRPGRSRRARAWRSRRASRRSARCGRRGCRRRRGTTASRCRRRRGRRR